MRRVLFALPCRGGRRGARLGFPRLGRAGARRTSRWSARCRSTPCRRAARSLQPRRRTIRAPPKLGRALFFDTRFSANGEVACATCHLPDRQFQDDRALAQGVGRTDRRTMPIAGMAHSPFLFWDGRKDSLWAQALGPLESAVEHGGDRTQYAHVVADHYPTEYEAVFGPLPDLDASRRTPARSQTRRRPQPGMMTAADREAVNTVFANIGKAIAAYERTIVPPRDPASTPGSPRRLSRRRAS